MPSRGAAWRACPGARGRWRPPRACPRGRRPGRPRHRRGRARPGRARHSGRRSSCPRRRRGGDLAQHLRVSRGDAGKVHHLAQPDDAGPGHRLGDVLGPDLVARRLEPRRRGGARGHLDEDVDRLDQRLVMHQPHAGQAEHVGDLVRVDEHGGRAVRRDGADELGDGQHARFDVHVAVAEAGHQEAPVGLDHLRRRRRSSPRRRRRNRRSGPPAMARSVPRISSPRMDVHPGAAAHDHVGGLAAGGDADQPRRAVLPGPPCGRLHSDRA